MDSNEQNQEKPQEEVTEQPAPVEAAPESAEAPEVTKEPEEKTSSKNVVIVAVLAIIVLVLAFMYIWGSTSLSRSTLPVPEIPEVPDFVLNNTAPEAPRSDEVEALEADLDTTDLDALDDELEEMEAELDTALEGL